MSKLLEGRLALILGIANKWSLAYAIARAFSREGASLALTYLGERQKESIEDLGKDLNVAAILPCDVTKDHELTALTESLRGFGGAGQDGVGARHQGFLHHSGPDPRGGAFAAQHRSGGSGRCSGVSGQRSGARRDWKCVVRRRGHAGDGCLALFHHTRHPATI